jgi:hypothetical protein
MSKTTLKDIEQYLVPGNIVMTGSKKFLSKAIQFFMKISRTKKGLPNPKGLISSHSAMIVDMWGQPYVAEALAKGIVVSSFADAYGEKLDKIKILAPKKAYSKDEKEKVSKAAISDSLIPHRYDYFGLLYQIKYVLSNGTWVGPKGDKAEKRLYCTEAVATWANRVRPNTFSQEEASNPIDIEFNKFYKVVYDGADIG